ncbi:hypothetical protein ACFWYW_46800 [Nonomuraea sp. NPDC059023]|uniref:hypothetical protein n=1 Tax=unclassified Nonomuraea TaxID=2593643 RepID=UPI0036B7A41E
MNARPRCPACLSGRVVAERRNINGENWRAYSCGHVVDGPKYAKVRKVGYHAIIPHEQLLDHMTAEAAALEETRRIIAGGPFGWRG